MAEHSAQAPTPLGRSVSGSEPDTAANGPIHAYVAMGDSFTEGLMDPDPGGRDNAFHGWADRLAVALTASPAGDPGLQYANLAIRGRTLAPILDEQLEAALDLRPDLVSVVAGGNDCLRPSADIDGLAARLERAVRALRREGIRVLMGNGYDTETMSPMLRALRSRVGVYNSHLWTIAARHGAMMLDLWGLRGLYAPAMWAPDRIHLSSAGHALVARAALSVLEHDTAAGLGFRLPHRRPRPVATALREETCWAREHLAPWVGRRLRGTSSGADLSPKYPAYIAAAGLVSSDGQDEREGQADRNTQPANNASMGPDTK